MQAVLHPELRDMKLVKVMIDSIEIPSNQIPTGWTLANVRKSFFSMIQNFVWGMIQKLAFPIARDRVSQLESIAEGDGRSGHLIKRRRLEDSGSKTMSMLRSMTEEDNDSTDEEPDANVAMRDPAKIVQKEIKDYFSIARSQYPVSGELIQWWHTQRMTMPCLSQVASALLACKAGSGGLECDFGSLGDILCPKRSSLGSGYVEATMMLKLNKDMVSSNPVKVILLDNEDWVNHVPTRPENLIAPVRVSVQEQLQVPADDNSCIGSEQGEDDNFDVGNVSDDSDSESVTYNV